MRYYAKCKDMLGTEILLVAKQETEEAAREYLHLKYKLQEIIELSDKPILDAAARGYWPTTSSGIKYGKNHPGRAAGRKVNDG